MALDVFQLYLGDEHLLVGDFVEKKHCLAVKSAGMSRVKRNIFVTSSEDIKKENETVIKKLLSDSQITKKEVNIIIPDSQSYSRIITMPHLTEKELASAIRYQADQFIPIPIDKVNMDIEILHEDKKDKTIVVLLVASSKSMLERVVTLVEGAGLTPVFLESQISASLRFITLVIREKEVQFDQSKINHALFMYIGNTVTSLILMDVKKNIPRSIHTIPLGRDIFKKDIASNYSVDEHTLERLVEEVGFSGKSKEYDIARILAPIYKEYETELQRFLLSVKDKDSIIPQIVYLYGEGVKIQGIKDKIFESTGITVSLFDPIQFLEKNKVVEFFASDWPLFISSLGGALREA